MARFRCTNMFVREVRFGYGDLEANPCIYVSILLPSVKIGRPGYRVTKQFDQETRQRSLLFQVCLCYMLIFVLWMSWASLVFTVCGSYLFRFLHGICYQLTIIIGQIEYPEIEEGTEPRHRFMSSYEQVSFSIIYPWKLWFEWIVIVVFQ